jgi:hypothetical protein
MRHDLKELEEAMKGIQRRGDPLLGETVSSLNDAAKAIGVGRRTLYRYRQIFEDFPSLPTFKSVLRWWAQKHLLPRRGGRQPSQRRKDVARLRGEGLSFREIGEKLGIHKGTARVHWLRHLKHPIPSPGMGYAEKGL